MEYWNVGVGKKEAIFHQSNIPTFRVLKGR